MFVQGEYYHGSSSDLQRARKPNSMGTFTLQEMDDDNKDEESDDDDEDDEEEDGEDVRKENTNGTWDDLNDAFQ